MAARENLKLLIVDDEVELRDILCEQLHDLSLDVGGRSYGLELATATNGMDALGKFQAEGFDALLTDINMPQMGGLDLLAALRGQGVDTPSIILTGFGDKSKAAEALRLGCFAFVEKPWNRLVLRKTVLAALERGLKLRPLNQKIDARLGRFASETDSRQRQLRTVFRSILVSVDGSHRNDVCPVPFGDDGDRKKPA